MKLDIQHVSNNYSITIGEKAFEALTSYQFQADGSNESLESQIQQIAGVSLAEVSYSNGEFGEEYEDFIGLALFADEATSEVLDRIVTLIKETIEAAFVWQKEHDKNRS